MKTFYHLLVNTGLSSVTNSTVWFALIYYVYLQTNSVFATSIISGIYLVLVAISGFWFGSLVDHHPKKQVMLGAGLVSILTFVSGLMIYLAFDKSVFTVVNSWQLWSMVIILMTGVISVNIRSIALPTLVTILVPEPDRDKANGLSGVVTGVSIIIVSAISGFLVAWGGMFYAICLAIALNIVTLLDLLSIDIEEPPANVADEVDQSKRVDISGTLKLIRSVPGLLALILFATFNNFLGGVFMSLMDAYGLSLMPVQYWSLLWGFLTTGFIFGGIIISKVGLGKNPVRALLLSNLVIWVVSSLFTLQPWIWLLSVGSFIYMCTFPYIEAAEQTIIQKVVPLERQGRVFGFAQSVEQAASPFTAFMIGPLTQFIFIPLMTDGYGANLIGSWFGTGPARGIALVFTLTGIIGIIVTLIALKSKPYNLLSNYFVETKTINK
ncbi:MAG: MFS transporter [Patescibacteria group bacterium]